MRPVSLALVFVLSGSILLLGQTQESAATQAPRQTARQALIEMFLGKASDAFEKHLPEVTHKVLIGEGEAPQMSIVKQIAMVGQQWSSSGHFETFDEGSLLVVSEPTPREKIEVVVEQDSFTGDDEIIEVSVHVYANGEPEFIPVLPRLSFTMKQEKEIWRLSEVTLLGRVPLEDPDYLKGVRKKQDEINERMVMGRISMIISSEAAYASKHPERGYTCKMSELFSDQTAQPAGNESGDNEALPTPDESNGYRFSLKGCDGPPASKFQLTAVPLDTESGEKAFCTDQSGKVRFSVDGKGPACLSQGEPLENTAAGTGFTVD